MEMWCRIGFSPIFSLMFPRFRSVRSVNFKEIANCPFFLPFRSLVYQTFVMLRTHQSLHVFNFTVKSLILNTGKDHKK